MIRKSELQMNKNNHETDNKTKTKIKNQHLPNHNTCDPIEIAKFAALSDTWWDKEGSLKTLHDINPARIAFIHQFANNLSSQRVLDVGCGGGILAEAMAILGADVTGVDAEADAISTAIRHAQKSNLMIDYQKTPIEQFEAAPFDLITCMEMLEHVLCPDVVILHCVRLLKPGGLLFLSTINRTIEAYLSVIIAAEYVFKLLPRQTHDYNKFIKPSELTTIARNLGLELLGLQGMSYNPFTREAVLQDSVSANYLICLQKPC